MFLALNKLQEPCMNMKWIIVGAVLAASGAILFRTHKNFRKTSIRFVQEPEELKNFGVFPPDIPKDEFESVDFL